MPSVAATLTWSRVGVQAFAAQPDNEWVATTFQASPSPPWAPWECFSNIPAPERLAAISLSNSFPELFAVTADGRLFVRRELTNGAWLPWEDLNLPWSNSITKDVSALLAPLNGMPSVLIADRDGIYIRSRTDAADVYAPYGAWQKLDSKTATRLTAGFHDDGTLEIFALDAANKLGAARQSSTNALTAWTEVPLSEPTRILDIDCGHSADGALVLYAVVESGALLMRTLETKGWSDWQTVEDPGIPKLVTVSTVPGDQTLFAVSDAGIVYRRSPGATWSPMP